MRCIQLWCTHELDARIRVLNLAHVLEFKAWLEKPIFPSLSGLAYFCHQMTCAWTCSWALCCFPAPYWPPCTNELSLNLPDAVMIWYFVNNFHKAMGLEFRVVVLSFGQSHKYLPELASLGNGHFSFLYWPPFIEVKWEPIPWVPSSSWLGDDSLYFRHIFFIASFLTKRNKCALNAWNLLYFLCSPFVCNSW